MSKELEQIKEYCYQRLVSFGLDNNDIAKTQYEKEINAITKFDYAANYYYMSCIIREARKKGVYAYFKDYADTSLVNYLLDITTTNPLEYGLDYRVLTGFDGEKKPSFYVNINAKGVKAVTETIKSLLPIDRILIYENGDTVRIIILPEHYKVSQAEKFRKRLAGSINEGDVYNIIYDYETVEPNFILYTFFHVKEADMLSALAEATNAPVESINLNDDRLISMYTSTEPLGIKDTSIGSIKNGMNGIISDPKLLEHVISKVNPKNVDEINIAYCLANGTGTWSSNGEDLLNKGHTLKQILSYQESVYEYLVSRGVDNKEAFEIMGFIRMGNACRPRTREQWESYKSKLNDKVEPWFIESVEKIKYMFSKSHGLAHVITDMKLAWYKLHYPSEFYKLYFQIYDCEFIHSKDFIDHISCIESINKWLDKHNIEAELMDKRHIIMNLMYEKLVRNCIDAKI